MLDTFRVCALTALVNRLQQISESDTEIAVKLHLATRELGFASRQGIDDLERIIHYRDRKLTTPSDIQQASEFLSRHGYEDCCYAPRARHNRILKFDVCPWWQSGYQKLAVRDRNFLVPVSRSVWSSALSVAMAQGAEVRDLYPPQPSRNGNLLLGTMYKDGERTPVFTTSNPAIDEIPMIGMVDRIAREWLSRYASQAACRVGWKEFEPSMGKLSSIYVVWMVFRGKFENAVMRVLAATNPTLDKLI